MQSIAKPTVAVFGATGHTGRFVVTELLRRGIVPIAIARNLAALTAANFGDVEVTRRRASVDDVDALDHILRVGLQNRIDDVAQQRDGAAVHPERQVIEDRIVRQHH